MSSRRAGENRKKKTLMLPCKLWPTFILWASREECNLTKQVDFVAHICLVGEQGKVKSRKHWCLRVAHVCLMGEQGTIEVNNINTPLWPTVVL